MTEARRIVIIQPYIADYRVPLFSGLGQRLREEGLSLTVAAGASTTGRHDEGVVPDIRAVRLIDRLGGSNGALRYRSLRPLQLQPSDHIIVEDAIKNLETWRQLFGRARSAVAMWGHGARTEHGRSRLPGIKQRLRLRADWYFAYTPHCAQTIVNLGFPADRVTSLHNTLDCASLRRDLDAVNPDAVAGFRSHHGLRPGRTALFLGSLDGHKAINYLRDVVACAYAEDPSFRLLIAGRGELEDGILRHPAGVGIGRVTGAQKAMALAVSDVILMPQGVGLVAVDALCSGVPIITRENSGHGPEADYLEPGIDSWWLPQSAPASEYARQVLAVLSDSAGRARAAQFGRSKAALLGMDVLVGEYAAGILEWIAKPSR